MDRRSSTRRLVVCLILATLVHVGEMGLIVPLFRSPEHPSLPRPERERTTEVIVRQEPSPRPSGRQIVSVNQPPTEQAPEDARFEDRFDRSVDQETVARHRGTTPEAVALAPPQVQPEASTPPQQQPRRREIPRRREEGQTDDQEVGVALRLETEQEPRLPQPRETTRRESEALSPRPEEPLSLAPFYPTMESASDLIAIPGETSIDHLDLPQGDRTQINSIENLYWSYWDRLKNQVRPHWQPASVYRSRDPTGRIFGVEDRYTVVHVTLNGDGSLRHLFLERSSDLDFLDREAMRAIQEAQPFANVPEGLKDERGLLSFRFGFYFEVSSDSFRIRREDW